MSVYGVKSFRAQKIKEQRTLNFNYIFFKHLKVKKRFLRQKLAWTYQIKCNFLVIGLAVLYRWEKKNSVKKIINAQRFALKIFCNTIIRNCKFKFSIHFSISLFKAKNLLDGFDKLTLIIITFP